MATFLLDTSVIIDAINNKRNRNRILRELLEAGHLLACCPINVTEVFSGMRPHEEARTVGLLHGLEYLPVTWPIARLAGEIKRDFARKGGATLATTDVTIAAVAIHHRIALLTDNVKHYPMKELDLYPLPPG